MVINCQYMCESSKKHNDESQKIIDRLQQELINEKLLNTSQVITPCIKVKSSRTRY